MPSQTPKKGILGVISGLLLAAGTPALGRLLLTLLGRLAASALGCRLLGGLAAGTPALRGGLLGATLLGCHADKILKKKETPTKIRNETTDKFVFHTKKADKIRAKLRLLDMSEPIFRSFRPKSPAPAKKNPVPISFRHPL